MYHESNLNMSLACEECVNDDLKEKHCKIQISKWTVV